MPRTNRETFPDELTGPHVEHRARAPVGAWTEGVKAKKKKMKREAKQVRKIKICGKRKLNSTQL